MFINDMSAGGLVFHGWDGVNGVARERGTRKGKEEAEEGEKAKASLPYIDFD